VTSVQEQAALLSARAERLALELERLNQALAANQQELTQARRGDRRAKGQD
jgi:chemotaxis protein MotB